jgi:hypothetical protein
MSQNEKTKIVVKLSKKGEIVVKLSEEGEVTVKFSEEGGPVGLAQLMPEGAGNGFGGGTFEITVKFTPDPGAAKEVPT